MIRGPGRKADFSLYYHSIEDKWSPEENNFLGKLFKLYDVYYFIEFGVYWCKYTKSIITERWMLAHTFILFLCYWR